MRVNIGCGLSKVVGPPVEQDSELATSCLYSKRTSEITRFFRARAAALRQDEPAQARRRRQQFALVDPLLADWLSRRFGI